jgi:DNA-binding NtrC family response regulator
MRILLVDDDQDSRTYLANYLAILGHEVTQRQSGEEALAAFPGQSFHMVLSDIKMEGISGIDLVREMKARHPESRTDIVLYTGFIDVELAIGALRAGAYDYLTKPINFSELGAVLDRVAEHQSLLQENLLLNTRFEERVKAASGDKDRELASLQSLLARQAGLDNFWAFSPAMLEVVRQARCYHTDRSIPVLIQGETGVGKEIVAKLIHHGDGQEGQPFIDINCTALTPSLFESELFGYEGGAFSGGQARGQKGKLDLASGGSLFLDEIAEIPVELQAKLLRVLEEKSYYRVGGLKKLSADIRVISATNLELDERIQTGRFRRDLYYRLKVGHLRVPPLRERPEDIRNIGLRLLQDFSRKRGKHFAALSDAAAERLLAYHWPGNVRELRNAMEWVSFMHDGEVLLPEHFENLLQPSASPPLRRPAGRSPAPRPADLPGGHQARDADLAAELEQALARFGGNKTQAARALGISIRTLYYRLERLRAAAPDRSG